MAFIGQNYVKSIIVLFFSISKIEKKIEKKISIKNGSSDENKKM